jgi:LppP/LprE lipoprotein
MDTIRASSLALAAAAGLALTACGSSTKTVSVSGTPPGSASQTHATTPAGTTPGTKTSAQGGPTTTRSAPEPAFAEQEHHGEGVSAATAVLRARGFTPTNTADYHSTQALQVMIGMHTGSGDGYGQQAFFFVNGRFIGTDASAPSATLRVVSQSDTEVTLAYPLYRAGDPLCCPGGGQAHVRFQLNNGKLTPLDPIPPLHSSTALSRY